MVNDHQIRVTIVGLNYKPEPTGIAPYTSGLASGLHELGWEIRAVTGYPHYPSWRVSEGYVGNRMSDTVDDVPVTRVRPYMPRNPSGLKRLLVELSFGFRSSQVAWGQPDVVVLVSPALFSSAIAIVRARLSPRRPKVVVWVQDLYGLGVSETGALGKGPARIMRLFESFVLRRADKVVVIHDRFKRHVVERLGLRSDDVEVIRNWTHLELLSADTLNYREKFGWTDEIVVLHAGNMGAKQALENVIDAARLADLSRANVRFVLLGNGNQRGILEARAAGIERIDFMESLTDHDFQGAMRAADILLVNEKPGVTEMAVPSKLTSYFAAGRPVIAATDEGSITAEEIGAAGAGVRVDAGHPQALLDAVMRLGADVESSKLFGECGARFQLQVLSRDSAISHYAEVIKRLARGQRHPAKANSTVNSGEV